MSVNAKNEGSMGEVQTASSFTAEAPADFRTHLQLRKKGNFSVLVASPKQARAARPGAPQAPQAARSAAAGGGQQGPEIKRHFWFRGFATNIEIRYKTT